MAKVSKNRKKKINTNFFLYIASKVFGDGEYIFGVIFVFQAIGGPLKPSKN